MKRIVLTFGLISGVLLSGMMVAFMAVGVDRVGMEHGMVIGYTMMVLAFLLVFFGIRSYRETVGDGRISFGRALGVGLLIMTICCICYVVTWEIVYFNFLHDFGDKYAAYVIEKARAAGASADEIAKQTAEMQKFKIMYDNPLYNAAFTFLEPLPVGIPMTLISAAILRKRRREDLSHG
jgi:hypothetical protein